MKKDITDIVLIVGAIIILLILPFVFGEQNKTKLDPPATEQEAEPAIPQPAPTQLAATTTNETEPAQLPPGIICMEDCPLIEVAPGEVEAEVHEYFSDIPIMIVIAKCESQHRQHKYPGVVLMNEGGSSATGVMQIMASIHEAAALRLGENIQTLEGNMAYGRRLYEQSGTTPWNASKYCWGNSKVATALIYSHISYK